MCRLQLQDLERVDVYAFRRNAPCGVGGGVGGMQLTGGEVISGAGRAEHLLHRECARGLCAVGLGF